MMSAPLRIVGERPGPSLQHAACSPDAVSKTPRRGIQVKNQMKEAFHNTDNNDDHDNLDRSTRERRAMAKAYPKNGMRPAASVGTDTRYFRYFTLVNRMTFAILADGILVSSRHTGCFG